MNYQIKYLFRLATILLMLLAVAVNRDGKIFGESLESTSASSHAPEIPVIRSANNGETVVATASLTKDVIGYAGTIPLDIHVAEGKITQVVILDNVETPWFIESLINNGLMNSWTGLSIEEAFAKKVDVVSGATMSSDAIIEGVRRGVLELIENPEAVSASRPSAIWSWKNIAILLTLLSALIVSFYVKSKTARLLQLVLNVAVLGFWSGTFISLSKMIGLLSNRPTFTAGLIPFLLLAIAFLFPLFGKKGYYCAWVCPLGSLQEIAGKVPYQLKLSAQLTHYLNLFREWLWMALLVIMWVGVGFELLNYELFSFFLFKHAGTGILIAGTLFLVLSTVVNRPYCRFVCPTGSVLKWCQQHKQ